MTPEPKKNLEAYAALLEVDAQERNVKARDGYMKAYVMSVLLPPLGIYYCAKYLFFSNGTMDDMKAGVISLALTLASLGIGVWISIGMFKQLVPAGSGGIDSLKDLTVPANQREIIKLYQ